MYSFKNALFLIEKLLPHKGKLQKTELAHKEIPRVGDFLIKGN